MDDLEALGTQADEAAQVLLADQVTQEGLVLMENQGELAPLECLAGLEVLVLLDNLDAWEQLEPLENMVELAQLVWKD